jgi:hypothetical protein
MSLSGVPQWCVQGFKDVRYTSESPDAIDANGVMACWKNLAAFSRGSIDQIMRDDDDGSLPRSSVFDLPGSLPFLAEPVRALA